MFMIVEYESQKEETEFSSMIVEYRWYSIKGSRILQLPLGALPVLQYALELVLGSDTRAEIFRCEPVE
jgi:hypothetical protein